MKFEPVREQIVLRAPQKGVENKTEGGIILPDAQKGELNVRYREAEVLAVSLKIRQDNEDCPRPGDTVMYNGFNDVSTNIEGTDCFITEYKLIDGITKRA